MHDSSRPARAPRRSRERAEAVLRGRPAALQRATHHERNRVPDEGVEPAEEDSESIPRQPFDAHVVEAHFPNMIMAKLAIADDLGQPLTKLALEDKAFIEQVLTETLIRRVVLERVRSYFRGRASHAD